LQKVKDALFHETAVTADQNGEKTAGKTNCGKELALLARAIKEGRTSGTLHNRGRL